MSTQSTTQLTIVEFTPEDHDTAAEMARRLGYTQTAYTSTSSLWGLFCLKDGPKHKAGCIIRTRELGLLFVSDLEDLNFHDLHEREVNPHNEHLAANGKPIDGYPRQQA